MEFFSFSVFLLYLVPSSSEILVVIDFSIVIQILNNSRFTGLAITPHNKLFDQVLNARAVFL